MQIKTVIFDIGNVLMDFCWHSFLEKKGFDEETITGLHKATVASPVWLEFDRGVWSEQEVMEGFIGNAPELESEIRKMFASTVGIVKQFDYAIPWIGELKEKGYQVLVLSNFPQRVYEECNEEMNFLEHVDGGILSYREKIVKPNPEIYLRLLERYGLQAEECVFLDDSHGNIEAARKLGIHGIVFTSRNAALEELSRLGVR